MRYIIVLTVVLGALSDAISTHLAISSGAGSELNPNFSGGFWLLNLVFAAVLSWLAIVVFPQKRCAESIRSLSLGALIKAASKLSVAYYVREANGRCVLAFFLIAAIWAVGFSRIIAAINNSLVYLNGAGFTDFLLLAGISRDADSTFLIMHAIGYSVSFIIAVIMLKRSIDQQWLRLRS